MRGPPTARLPRHKPRSTLASFEALAPEWCRLDRLAGLGGLLAEVAHEVRNPLTALRSFVALLPERAQDPEFRDHFAEIADAELARIERLLDCLLEHASAGDAGAAAPTPDAVGACEVGEAIASVTRLLAQRAAAAGIRLEAEVAPGLPRAALAGDALRQVLLNLAFNALDATPAGGDVRIGARELGRTVEVCVEDRGAGVPRAVRRHIFEPFYSTRVDRPGGLGLAISRRLVGSAGGTIAIGDRPGGGSRFRVRLPAVTSR